MASCATCPTAYRLRTVRVRYSTFGAIAKCVSDLFILFTSDGARGPAVGSPCGFGSGRFEPDSWEFRAARRLLRPLSAACLGGVALATPHVMSYGWAPAHATHAVRHTPCLVPMGRLLGGQGV